MFARTDIDHFFMSGTSSEFSDLCSQLFDDGDEDLQLLIQDGVFSLLDSQWIELDVDFGDDAFLQDVPKTYKVIHNLE